MNSMGQINISIILLMFLKIVLHDRLIRVKGRTMKIRWTRWCKSSIVFPLTLPVFLSFPSHSSLTLFSLSLFRVPNILLLAWRLYKLRVGIPFLHWTALFPEKVSIFASWWLSNFLVSRTSFAFLVAGKAEQSSYDIVCLCVHLVHSLKEKKKIDIALEMKKFENNLLPCITVTNSFVQKYPNFK